MFLIASDASNIQMYDTHGDNFSISVDIVNGTTGEVKEHFDQDTFADWRSDLSWLPTGGLPKPTAWRGYPND